MSALVPLRLVSRSENCGSERSRYRTHRWRSTTAGTGRTRRKLWDRWRCVFFSLFSMLSVLFSCFFSKAMPLIFFRLLRSFAVRMCSLDLLFDPRYEVLMCVSRPPCSRCAKRGTEEDARREPFFLFSFFFRASVEKTLTSTTAKKKRAGRSDALPEPLL